MKFASVIVALLLSVLLTGCNKNSIAQFQQASADYQAVVTAINADIAATAPLVAARCVDLQKVAMLIAPFVPRHHSISLRRTGH